MPVRVTTATRLAQDVTGVEKWTFTEPDNCSYDEFVEATEVADAIYYRFVHEVDWSRVLIEAQAAHIRKSNEGPHGDPWTINDDVCGYCIRDALLASDRKEEPQRPLPTVEDWPKGVAKCLTYRRNP